MGALDKVFFVGLRDVFRLEESTVVTARRLYNLLVRAVMFGSAIVILGGMSVGFHFLIAYAASFLGLDQKTQDLLKAGSASFFVVLVIVAFLLSIGDVLKLLWYYLSGRDDGHD